MFDLRKLRFPFLLIALFAFTLGTTGCDDDNPAAPSGDEDDHMDFDGIVIETEDGTVLAHQWGGAVSGGITVDQGGTLTGVQIWFLEADSTRARPGHDDHDHDHDHGGEDHDHEGDDHDHDGEDHDHDGDDHDHDGDDHDHDHGGDEFELASTVDDPATVQITKHGDEDWAVDLSGLQAGQTTVRFMVMHGGHADFTSLALPVTVNATSAR